MFFVDLLLIYLYCIVGVSITSEEINTESGMVMKVKDHNEHLRNAFRRMPAATMNSNVPEVANASFVIEDPSEDSASLISIDPFPPSHRSFNVNNNNQIGNSFAEPRDRRLELCRHLELFNRIDQNKSIAEWEFAPELKGQMPTSHPARALAIPDSENRRRNEVEVPLIPINGEQVPLPSLSHVPLITNFYELGRKASLFNSHDSCRIEIQVKSKVSYSTLELGHAIINVEDLELNRPQELWIPVIHKKTGKQVASLSLGLHMFEPC